jgi:hypothetical protein
MAEACRTPTHQPELSESSDSPSPRREWRKSIRGKASDFFKVPLADIAEEVTKMNNEEKLWPSARELVDTLHLRLPVSRNDTIQMLMVGQYNVAKKKKKIGWLKEFRGSVAIHQNEDWMIANIGYRPRRRKEAAAVLPGTLVRDCRLNEDPNIPTISVDLGHSSSGQIGSGIKPEPMELVEEIPEVLNTQSLSTVDVEPEPVPEVRENMRLPRSRRQEQRAEVGSRSRSRIGRHHSSSPDRSVSPPVQGRRRKSGVRVKSCPILSCSAVFRNLRRHMTVSHLPSLFTEAEMADRTLDVDRMQLVGSVRQILVGNEGTFSDLVEWVNSKRAISSDAFVPDSDRDWLTGICQNNFWDVPEKFLLNPVNSKALLFHWRVLAVLLSNLSSSERMRFQQGRLDEDLARRGRMDLREKLRRLEETSDRPGSASSVTPKGRLEEILRQAIPCFISDPERTPGGNLRQARRIGFW